MISYEEALDRVLAAVPAMPAVDTRTEKALGMALARPLRARSDQPGTDQSAMDGYAVLLEDVRGATPDHPRILRVAGESPAGARRVPPLRPGTAVRVLTGGRIPRATEAIVVQEHTKRDGDRLHVLRAPQAGANIRRRGEEVHRGVTLLEAGTVVDPAVVGLAVTHGYAELRVRARPRVTVLTTGNELVDLGERRRPGQIFDSNGPAVVAALQRLGVTHIRRARVVDDLARTTRRLKSAIERSDVVLTVGGASVGDYDHLGQAREHLGVRELFHKVAIKPGKPNIVGIAPSGVPVFSLPGNPVSALVSFEILVAPALRAMMGYARPRPVLLPACLTEDIEHKPGRTEWVRARQKVGPQGLEVTPVSRQGSHMVTGLAEADALLVLAPDRARFGAGETLPVLLLDMAPRC